MKAELIHFSGNDGNTVGGPHGEPHHLFFGEGLNRPSRTEHLWIMTQLARWAEIPFPRNWVEILERVCNVSVFSTAARELGLESISYQRQGIELFDGRVFNAEDPISYLNDQSIHQDFSIAEIPLAPSRALAST
jgi:hypothetical protein